MIEGFKKCPKCNLLTLPDIEKMSLTVTGVCCQNCYAVYNRFGCLEANSLLPAWRSICESVKLKSSLSTA